MSNMQKPHPVAIACSDLHLSHRAPVARSAEPDWYEAMARPVHELRDLARKLKVPILCAGDVFDRWNANPELINWAIENLPEMYAIPGQHDLPLHRYEDMHKSAYWTLVQAGIMENMEPGKEDVPRTSGLWVHPFPWGFEPKPTKPKQGLLQVAVLHAFCWLARMPKETGYPGAPKEQTSTAWSRKLGGFDLAIFGDNHKGFLLSGTKPVIFNHGTFLRRHIDEIDYEPHLGIVMSNGSVERHKLDCSKDRFMDPEEVKVILAEGVKMEGFLRELESLGGSELDFRAAIRHYLDQYEVSPGARKIISAGLDL